MTSVIPAVVVLSLPWLFLVEHCSAQDITVPSNDSAIFLVDIAKDICSVSQPCPPAQSCKVLEQVGYICRCPMGYVGVNCTTECRTHAADIAFLLDSSDSISDEDWVKMLRFVSSLVGQLQVDEGYHRIAVITFGDEATLEIRLDDYKTTKDIIARVKDLRHKKERTNIAGSLRLMRTAVFDNTDQHMQIGFLITDGASNVEREHTFNEARLVKESGIAMFAIGIGELIRPIELEAVASKPLSKHLFMEYNFEALQNIMNIVLEATCKLMPTYSAGGTGATGEQGVTGIRGVIGPAGHTGTLGSRGAKGEMGERGRIGQAGVPGSKGERGTTGATGATGKPGLTGVPGNTGFPGDPGDPGSPGISIPGPTGVQGRPGQQGRVGNTGPAGDIGLPGPVGKPGLTGTTGFGGVVGSLGMPGATGYTGEEGRTGSTGLPGPPGEDGPTGYIYEDSNECALNTSLCQHICINKRNGYKCQCYPGYKLLGDGFTCAEIDECLVENGGCEQQCVNTPGSFVCSCVFGYTMSKDRRTCIDVNECCSSQVPVIPCPATHVCINTRGSYACILHQRVRVPGQELKFQTTVVANDTITASMFLQRNVIIGVFIWLCVLTVLTILCVLLANSMSEPPSNQTSVLLPDPYYYDERPRPSGPPAEDHQHQDGLTKYNIEDNGHRLSDPVAAQIEINHRPESVIQNNTN